MSKEYQTDIKYLDYYMMPIRQDCFDWKVKAKMAVQPYMDEFRQEIEPLETRTYYIGETEIKSGSVSQEDVDIFVNLVNNTKKKVIFDEEMMDLVWEEAQAYFKGDKSLDETADIIQQRITTYVNERN